MDGGRWRHVKRGTDYTVVAGEATLQTSLPMTDGADLIVYRGDDGKVWARPVTEFADGRFERLYDPPYAALLAIPAEWLEPGAVVPVDAETTSHLIRMVRELLKPDVPPKMARHDTHRLVPRVPTEAMVDALDNALADCHDSRQALILAIEAAPTP